MRHPLHPMLAHFPVACWALASCADLAIPRWGEPAWQLAGTLMALGLLLALPTLLAGLFELIHVPDEPQIMRIVWAHMGCMVVAFVLYGMSLLLRLEEAHIIAPSTGGRVLSLIALGVLLAGGWLGGALVYGHGVGRAAPPGEDA